MAVTRSKSKKEEPPVTSLNSPSRPEREVPLCHPEVEAAPCHQITTNGSEIISTQQEFTLPFRRCAGCTLEKAADVWCCECSRCLCSDCDERRHATDTLDSLRRPMCSHRVELIADGGGIPILSSLLEIAVIGFAGWTLRPLLSAASTMLNVDYFLDEVCPTVKYFRLIVFRMDHALYPLLRGTLGAWCDTEDAFIKIFVDIWVRGILTNTDSFALLCIKIPNILGALLIVLTVAPLLAIPYAVIATVVRLFELAIIPNWSIIRALSRLIHWSNVLLWAPLFIMGWFTRSTALGLIMDDEYRQTFHRRLKIPPKTGHRIRPTISDGIEDVSLGSINRVTRVFWYFHRKARRTIVGVVLTGVFVAVVIRIVLLALPRCGRGILSVSSVKELLDIANDTVGTGQGAACVSVHALIRHYAEKIGVQTPDYGALGEEAQVLSQLQDSTENDYIDQVLRLALHASYHRFMSYPLIMRLFLCVVFSAVCSAGVLRRVLYWVDLRRRNRYSAAIKKANANKEEIAEEKDGSTDEHTLHTIDLDDESQETLIGPSTPDTKDVSSDLVNTSEMLQEEAR